MLYPLQILGYIENQSTESADGVVTSNFIGL